jgi:hypothetical protein
MGSKLLELEPLPSNWVNQLPKQHWYLQLLFGTKSFSKGLANEKEKIISLIFQRFSVISQILSSMFDNNVYSIIDSKVFGVTFGVNFLLPL